MPRMVVIEQNPLGKMRPTVKGSLIAVHKSVRHGVAVTSLQRAVLGCADWSGSLCCTGGKKHLCCLSANASEKAEKNNEARLRALRPLRQFNPWVSVFVFHLLDC